MGQLMGRGGPVQDKTDGCGRESLTFMEGHVFTRTQ